MEALLSTETEVQSEPRPNQTEYVLAVEQYPVIHPKFIRGNDDEGGEGNK